MLQNIFIIVILSFWINISKSQSTLDFRLLEAEREIFLSTDSIEKNFLIYNKFHLLLAEPILISEAMKEAKRIKFKALPDETSQKKFLWNAALVAQLNNELNRAQFYYNNYLQVSSDSTIESRLLGVLINAWLDTTTCSKIIANTDAIDDRFKKLNCLIELAGYERQHRKLFVFSSAVLPGLGMALQGEVIKGFTAFSLFSVTGYAIYLLASNNLYFNAFGWGIGLITKFYGGNLRLTNSLFESKENKQKNMLAVQCEHVLDELLREYPLKIK